MMDGRYLVGHLHALDRCRPAEGYHHPPTSNWNQIVTPLQISEWRAALNNHPDKEFTSYILSGIQKGFRLGYERPSQCKAAKSNMLTQHPEVVLEYLLREVGLGRMVKIEADPATLAHIQISPLGLIPKKNKPNKWRLIVDLSSPKGRSVNDGINSSWSMLSYASVDHLATLILEHGQGAFLVKADIQEAYRMIPVHPQDRWLLGVQWQGELFIDLVLLFGLRSAPKIFSTVADAIQWILRDRGIEPTLHYLDDFILVAGSEAEAMRKKERLMSTFESLGVPLEPSKLEGPSTCFTFLGIEVDTTHLQLRLPREKLEKLEVLLETVLGKRAITKKDLQSLVGLLQHATKVVKPGRSFTRRLHALLSKYDGDHAQNHFIRLSALARSDILWWRTFAMEWNGVSLVWATNSQAPDVQVTSDASGHWGCGAYWLPHWLYMAWTPRLQHKSIQVKELFPVVAAAGIFGKQWVGKIVQFRVDNEAVVEIIKEGYSRDPHLMHMVRMLVFLACYFQFWFTAVHIAGSDNTLADAISRNNFELFLSQASPTPTAPTTVPAPLVDILSQVITWTSTSWIASFSTIIHQL